MFSLQSFLILRVLLAKDLDADALEDAAQELSEDADVEGDVTVEELTAILSLRRVRPSISRRHRLHVKTT